MIRSKIKRLKGRRSSRLIWVVGGGVALVLLAFFTLVIVGGGGRSAGRVLAYLKRTEGVAEVRTLEREKRALIVYRSDSKNAANFEKVAYYAALRLAAPWPDCEVLLARDRAEQVVYRVRVRSGEIVAEGKP